MPGSSVVFGLHGFLNHRTTCLAELTETGSSFSDRPGPGRTCRSGGSVDKLRNFK